MDEVERLAKEHRPKMILAGWSAYSRVLDFPRFREIADEVGALLMVDMAHFAGLVAAGEHPSPVPYADVTTTTVHKTLGGPRSGLILCKEEYAKKINSAVFPGQQGGPLEHAIAAKAVAFKIAASDLFKERQKRTVAGAKALAEELLTAGSGVNVLTGGTDVHLVLVDLRDSELDGQQAEDRLHSVGITVNRNAVPFDPRPPMVTSGLRIGTPALATRGLQVDDFHEVGKIIARALQPGFDDARGRAGRARDRRSRTATRSTRTWARRQPCRRERHRDTLTAEAVSGMDEHERDALARLTLLARVGAILGSGLRRQETLERVADLLVPGVRGLVRDRPRRRATASSSAASRMPDGVPARCRRTRRTAPRSSCARASPSSCARSPRTRCSPPLAATGASSRPCAMQLSSAMCVPLTTGAQVLGTISLLATERHYGAGRARADVARSRAAPRPRSRSTAAAQRSQMLFDSNPHADVGLRHRDPRVPRRQRRRAPPLRLLAGRVPPADDPRHPAARRGTARCTRSRSAAPRARGDPIPGGISRRTAADIDVEIAADRSTSRAVAPGWSSPPT